MPEGNTALLSLHPRHATKILAGEKRFEFRRVWANRPVSEIVIYATAPVQRIVAIARVRRVHHGSATALWKLAQEIGGGLSRRELFAYFDAKSSGYAIEIDSIITCVPPLDPKALLEGFRPPQSFRYLDKTAVDLVKMAMQKRSCPGRVIFVAGVHGVGKTTLCEKFSLEYGLLHRSASQLIREAKETAIASHTKIVNDIEGNQKLLVRAVQIIRSSGKALLLDGHFALLNAMQEVEAIPSKVFTDLSLDGIVVINDDPISIAARIAKRDLHGMTVGEIDKLQMVEVARAEAIAKKLGIPISKIRSFDESGFMRSIKILIEKTKQ